MKYFLLLLTLIALTTNSLEVQSQTTFKYGAELGLAFSQFPKTNSYIIQIRNDKVTETTVPLFSPLIGMTTELTVKKYLQLNAGLQYQMTGNRYHYHRDGNDLSSNKTYRHDQWENQTFHKLCLPLKVGIAIQLYKLHPTIFIGYRPNYFISGKYYSKSVFEHDIDSLNFSTENEFNPLDSKKIELPVKHFHHQYFYGIAIGIGKHLKISVTVNSGRKYILYSESSISCLPYGFKNNDYLATITYLFSTPKKKTNCIK